MHEKFSTKSLTSFLPTSPEQVALCERLSIILEEISVKTTDAMRHKKTEEAMREIFDDNLSFTYLRRARCARAFLTAASGVVRPGLLTRAKAAQAGREAAKARRKAEL